MTPGNNNASRTGLTLLVILGLKRSTCRGVKIKKHRIPPSKHMVFCKSKPNNPRQKCTSYTWIYFHGVTFCSWRQLCLQYRWYLGWVSLHICHLASPENNGFWVFNLKGCDMLFSVCDSLLRTSAASHGTGKSSTSSHPPALAAELPCGISGRTSPSSKSVTTITGWVSSCTAAQVLVERCGVHLGTQEQVLALLTWHKDTGACPSSIRHAKYLKLSLKRLCICRGIVSILIKNRQMQIEASKALRFLIGVISLEKAITDMFGAATERLSFS